MPSGLSRRFWLESVLGSITGVVAIITLFWHDWIETIFGVDPDRGNGSAEWLVILILLAVTLILAIGARLEWRGTRISER
jgi:DMSO/TMAO reductase YedYZ heme-binding membrane subunit